MHLKSKCPRLLETSHITIAIIYLCSDCMWFKLQMIMRKTENGFLESVTLRDGRLPNWRTLSIITVLISVPACIFMSWANSSKWNEKTPVTWMTKLHDVEPYQARQQLDYNAWNQSELQTSIVRGYQPVASAYFQPHFTIGVIIQDLKLHFEIVMLEVPKCVYFPSHRLRRYQVSEFEGHMT